ncbi:MAG: hypothetical protein WAO98_01615 [Alphaproteobacteria bacterium]
MSDSLPESVRASFRTHLNYIKCIEKLLLTSKFFAKQIGSPIKSEFGIRRFKKLNKITVKSIERDIELAREDPEFGMIIAPWFPVKCYYALYYFESILINLIDGDMAGFRHGGHGAVRKKICNLVSTKNIYFDEATLDMVYSLSRISSMPPINPGQNTKNSYWSEVQCGDSVAKKLFDYKLYDRKINKKWNLYSPKDRAEKKDFIKTERLMLIDFFYWYRIKANYRDFDYIDFENGITPAETLQYLESYFNAFRLYSAGLMQQIERLDV